MTGMFIIVLLTLFATPYFIKFLGPEAFGLVGFFYLFSMCLSTFDLGMSPYLQREIAKFTKNKDIDEEFRKVIQVISIYFVFIIVTINILAFPFSELIINYWFSLDAWEVLPIIQVEQSIKLIFLTSSLLVLVNLFKFGLTGCHYHYWLNIFLIIISLLRYIGSILLISIFDGTIVDFFIYQAFVALISVVVMGFKFYQQLPEKVYLVQDLNISFFKKVFSNTTKIAALSILWIVTYQLDKVLLSKTLPLVEYGYFSLITILCAGIIMIAGPIKRAIQPTISIMFLSDGISKSIDLYRKASHLITIISSSLVITLCLYSVPIALFWTKDLTASLWIADRLYLFVIGAGLASIQSILLALQESRGDLKLQIKLNTIFLIIQIPLMLFGVLFYGVVGIGMAWMFTRIFSFIISLYFIHNSYDKNLNKNWFFKDFLPVILIQVFIAFILSKYLTNEVIFTLEYPIVGVLFAGITIFLSSFLSSHYLYAYFSNNFR